MNSATAQTIDFRFTMDQALLIEYLLLKEAETQRDQTARGNADALRRKVSRAVKTRWPGI